MRSISEARRVHGDAAAMAVAFALFLTYFDLLKAHRSSFWVGATPQQWLGVALVAGFYALVLFALTELLLHGLRRVAGERIAPDIAVALAAWFAATLVWSGVVLLGGEARMVPLLAVPCALLLPILALIWFGPTPRPRAALVAATTAASALAAISALVVENCVCFLSDERASFVSRRSVEWLGISFFWLTIWSFPSHSRLRRAVLWGLATVAFVGLPLLEFWPDRSGPQRRNNRPNLILITCDALRADYCGLYGGTVPTPMFEALGARGVVFDAAYSLAPWTLPSMNGMFASTYPPGMTPTGSVEQWQQEMGRYAFPSAQAMHTLAERLSGEGCACGGFTGNTLLQDPKGILRGFKDARAFGHRMHTKTGVFSALPFFQNALDTIAPRLVRKRPVDTSRILTAYAREFIRANQSAPFFLWIHFMDPHAAYDPPDEFRTRKGPWPLFCPADPYWGTPRADIKGNIKLTPDQQAYVRSLYQGEIRYVDQCIGRIREQLAAFGLEDLTYLCVTADHGEEFWDHGRYGHGQSLYSELVRVPLLIAGPGIVPNRIAEPVSTIDLMPTFAELMNLTPDPSRRGVSLAGILRGESNAPPPHPCFAQATNFQCTPEPLQVVVSGKYKLIRGIASGTLTLFDLEKDPQERVNLAEAQPDLAAQLEAQLRAWSDSFPSTFDKIPLEEGAAQSQQDVLEQLRAVGYLH